MANVGLLAFHETAFEGPTSELVSYKEDSTGRKRVYGNKSNLKTSQGYPRMFGEGASSASSTSSSTSSANSPPALLLLRLLLGIPGGSRPRGP